MNIQVDLRTVHHARSLEGNVSIVTRPTGAETRAPAWQERSRPGTRSAQGEEARQTGIWAGRDDANPIGLLAARYPVTCHLVGRSSFRCAARRFLHSNPPEKPFGHGFGDAFPRFLRSLGDLACIEYVADVAELELLRHNAEHAFHAPPLATPALSKMPRERLDRLRLVLHPSVCLIQSRFPIVTAWENNRTSRASGTIERWVGEAAMVARPFLKVEVRRLPPGGHAFLRALSEGQTVASAVASANGLVAEFDVSSSLRLIDDAKVIVGMRS